jgi:uncharacterized protein (TIGR02099 family)
MTMALRLRRWLKRLALTAIGLLLLAALTVGALALWIDRSPTLTRDVVARVELITGLHLRFSGLTARLGWFGPELSFREVHVLNAAGAELLAARVGRVGVDWFRMALTRRPAARVTLDGPALGVEWTDAGVRFVGQPAPSRAGVRLSVQALPTGRLHITNARLTLTDRRTLAGPGGRRVAFNDVDIDLTREAHSLHVAVGIDLPASLGRRLDVRVQLVGSLQDPSRLAWNTQVQASRFQWAGWHALLPAAVATARLPLEGEVEFRFDAAGHGSTPDRAQWDVEGRGVVVPTAAPATAAEFILANAPPPTESCGWGPPEALPIINVNEMTRAYGRSLAALGIDRQPALARYSRLAFAGKLVREGALTRMTISDLDAVSGPLQWRGGKVELAWDHDARGIAGWRVHADSLQPAALVPLAGLLPQSALRQALANLSPRGAFTQVDLQFRRDAGWHPVGQMQLQAVGLGPVGRIPGATGLSGSFVGSAGGGELQLASPTFRLLLPQYLRAPEAANLHSGRFRWRQGEDGLRIVVDDVAVARADGSGTAMARLWLPADGSSPVLSLHAEVRDVDVRSTTRLLPAVHLAAAPMAWLDGAFVAGRVPEGSIDYAGHMRCYPFRYGGGEFRVRVLTDDVQTHYADGWPDLEHLAADVQFLNGGFSSVLLRGTVGGLTLKGGAGGIADFRDGLLEVNGEGNGDLGRALGLVQRSPIGPELGALFNGLRGTGAAHFSTRLHLPLRNLAARQVDVRAVLANATLRFDGIDEVATAVNGNIHVLDEALESTGLTARWLGGPVRFTARRGGTGVAASNLLEATGRAQGERVTALLRLPEEAIGGAFDWRFTGRLPLDGLPGRAARSSYRVDSTMEGAEVHLPAPLEKSAAEVRPLRAELGVTDLPPSTPRSAVPRTRFVTQLQWGHDSAALEWMHEGAWHFMRGTARLGAAGAELKDASRLWIEGHAAVLDASGWLRLRLPAAVGARSMKVEELLRGASVTADQLMFLGYVLPHTAAQLSGTEEAWRVDVEGPSIAGRVLVPYDLGAGRLQLDLERLNANDTRAGGAAGDSDPRGLPAMHLAVRALEFEHRQLGQLTADLVRTPSGLRLTRAEVKAPTFSALGSGSWALTDRSQGRAEECRVQLEVQSTDVAGTLTALTLAPALSGKRGHARIDVHWPGGPNEHFFEHLEGQITVRAEEGQVLTVEPGAGGRALGLLSLGALQRRLTLDFSDLTGKGLAFDEVRGDFELRDGDAYTRNLVLKGPAAEIGIVGRTGLRARDYDQTVKVTGDLGGTLVAAGTLAGGPAVGAALLLFSKVFKEPLNGMSRGYYRITGNWDTPEVQRIGASEAQKIDAAREVEQSRPPAPVTPAVVPPTIVPPAGG